MSKVIKPPLSVQQIIDHISQKYNVLIKDKNKASRYIENIGYYRFYGYMIPFFEDNKREHLISDTKFEDIVKIYIFDRKLRLLILEALERIELSIRAIIVDNLANKYNDGCFYANLNNFDKSKQEKLKEFIEHLHLKIKQYKDKELFNSSYLDNHQHLPHPYAWLAFQNISFDRLVGFLHDVCNNEQVKEIATHFNMSDNVVHFKGYIRHLKDLRNICAHHARCWNKEYPIIQEAEPLSRKLQRYIKFNSKLYISEKDKGQLSGIISSAKQPDTQELINKLISFAFLKSKLNNFKNQNSDISADKLPIKLKPNHKAILIDFLNSTMDINSEIKKIVTRMIEGDIKYDVTTQKRISNLLIHKNFEHCFFIINYSKNTLQDIHALLSKQYPEPDINKYLPFFDDNKVVFNANKRLYSRIEVIWYFIKIINPHSTWSKRVYELMEEYKLLELKSPSEYLRNISQVNMGFPENWHKDHFWNLNI